MSHPNSDNETQSAVTLDEAIAQAVLQHQAALAAAATAAQAERQQAEQKAIERFKLPFDDATIAALPPLNFRFGEDLSPIAWFEYQELTVEVAQQFQASSHCETWSYAAQRQGIEVVKEYNHVYPNCCWAAYCTPAQEGQDFLLFLNKAANTPTPAPEPAEPETFLDPYSTRKRRERFIKAAMQGTLIGLTNTGLEAGACLQTALFAIETAEQVLALMAATPLQRTVLSVLSLEQFTHWLSRLSPLAVVGTLADYGDHPVCNYIQQACGVSLEFSNLALNDKTNFCVLGNEGTAPIPHGLPLHIAGEWLPALLNWKEADPDIQTDCPTFTAGEVLAFLKPFQR